MSWAERRHELTKAISNAGINLIDACDSKLPSVPSVERLRDAVMRLREFDELLRRSDYIVYASKTITEDGVMHATEGDALIIRGPSEYPEYDYEVSPARNPRQRFSAKRGEITWS